MAAYALFAFNGEPMCFVHVLLNALDLSAKGHRVALVIEGAACGLVPGLEREDAPLRAPWQKVKEAGLVAGACRACSAKQQVTQAVEAAGLALLDDMQGHPSMERWLRDGYTLITF